MSAVRLLFAAAFLTLTFAAPASAIVGGQVTTKPWPHMTAVEFRGGGLFGGSGFSFGCGGSLVRPDVVLTAAHCVSRDDDGGADTLPASDVRVQFPPTRADGTRRRSDGGERIAVKQVLEHPGYDGSREGGSDVALLKLASASTVGRAIRLAGPADAGFVAAGTQSTVIGWGSQVPFGPPEDALREVTVPIVSDDDCEAFSTSELDRPTQLCAGELEGTQDSCQGDSGGPLMVRDGGGAWILAGVVSQGVGCGTPTQYGIYAEVSGDPLRSWVETNATRLSTVGGTTSGGSTSGGGTTGGGTTGGGTTGGGGDGSTSGSADSTSGGSGSESTPPQGGGSIPTGSSDASKERAARLRLPARLGSVRRARRRGAFLIRLRFNVPVSIAATLRQRGRTVARGTRRKLRSGTLRLRVRDGVRLRRGKAVLRVVVRDARGRRYVARRTVRLRR